MKEKDYPEAFDKIATAFLDRWLLELRQIPAKMADFENSDYRSFLSRYDPYLSKIVEGHTRNETRKGLENVALAYAVTEAILTALESHQAK